MGGVVYYSNSDSVDTSYLFGSGKYKCNSQFQTISLTSYLRLGGKGVKIICKACFLFPCDSLQKDSLPLGKCTPCGTNIDVK